MAKQKFDPSIIQKRESAGSLPPTDFMRLLNDVPQPTLPPEPPKLSTTRPPAVKTKHRQNSENLEMPPERRVEPRITVLFRSPVELDERLRQFVQDHHSSIQDSCMMAVDEFLNRRGY
ncbi:MAG TPA: hypothetical protein VMR95_03405 [Candidatus Binatia bacterium]|nr:hypothetical protein [Candidatus Binatia bacterium]